MYVLWNWTVCYFLYFVWICGNSTLADYVSQKSYLNLEKVALLGLQLQLGLSQSLKHHLQMIQVLVNCLAKDQDVVQIAETNLPLELSKYSLH